MPALMINLMDDNIMICNGVTCYLTLALKTLTDLIKKTLHFFGVKVS